MSCAEVTIETDSKKIRRTERPTVEKISSIRFKLFTQIKKYCESKKNNEPDFDFSCPVSISFREHNRGIRGRLEALALLDLLSASMAIYVNPAEAFYSCYSILIIHVYS